MVNAKKKYDEYMELLVPIMYKVMGDYYYSKATIDTIFGLDISDLAWQIPYSNLRKKDKDRFIDSVNILSQKMGNDSSPMILILNTSMSIEEQIEFSEAIEFIIKYNRGDIRDEDSGVVVKDEASDYLDLANRSYSSLMTLSGNDGEFTDEINEFVRELEKLIFKSKEVTKEQVK